MQCYDQNQMWHMNLGSPVGYLLSGKSQRFSSNTVCFSPTGGRVKTWKRRWFILTDNCLYYFEYTTDKEPRGIIPLENLSIREVDEPRKPNCFELYNPNHKGQVIKACKTEADGRVVEGNHVVYRISAPTPEEKEEWIKSIKASISRDPFYDMLATRKRRIANKK
ncbi:Cytohesin-3 [Ataeniobius toweri]|uniref:Cytohesin-3 n=1 Tax=Ataeniobius toweri TaxID=208326 RepID=A0ABU7A4G5_9TELE|nr:Cytohesin-3 [Ataeniobius toweri]